MIPIRRRSLQRHQVHRYLGNNRATFEFPNGHRFDRVVIPLKGRSRRRPPTEAAIKMVLSWWSKTGVTDTECPTCKRNRGEAK